MLRQTITERYAELEVGLHRRDAESYTVELRFSQPESDAEVRIGQDSSRLVVLDLNELDNTQGDEASYGLLLGRGLFADPEVLSAFLQARASAQSLDAPLRLRLLIGPGAPELHSLRWESMRDPQSGELLFTGEQILFSRYLSSGDWRPVLLRPAGALSALVVIANPTNLSDYALAPLDVAGEQARAVAGLGDIPITSLASGGSATLAAITAQLREGYDILYLICHGAFVEGQPLLWLEDEQGAAAPVPGERLATLILEARERPRLVVLASCQSAGENAGVALTAIGPRLAEAGIPAVVAMQDLITMKSIADFMPVFFHELQRDGQIDRAMALARGAIRDQPDAGVPVLFLRLRSGRIWYVPGFGEDGQSFEKWPALLRSISRARATPILGPGLDEGLLGSTRDIARSWAETYHFPLRPHAREDLPQVAQFLSVNQDTQFPRDELIEHLGKELRTRYGAELSTTKTKQPIDKLIAAVGAHSRERNPADPNKVLAELPFSIYVTASPSNLLAEALRAAGKDPVEEICRWNQDLADLPSIFEDDPTYQPDEQRPLVYQLFGSFSEPDSLVLTEDDYFDFLIGTSLNKELIPIAVRAALADTALLFMGFHLDDWSFRIIFRTLMSQEGRGRRRKYAHVAGQIFPEEGRVLQPERTRAYLESYFQDSDITIYWGSVEDFTRELTEQMRSVAL